MLDLSKIALDVKNAAEISGTATKTAGPILKALYPEMKDNEEAREFFIRAIEEDDSFSITEKTLMISERKKLMRELKNKISVAALADKLLEKDNGINVQEVINNDLEWFDRFFDQAKYVSGFERQVSWSCILAQKISGEKEVPLVVIRILAEISKEQAEAFALVCSQTVIVTIYDSDGHVKKTDEMIVVPYMDNSKKNIVSFEMLNELERIGLINFSSLTGYTYRVGEDACTYSYEYYNKILGNIKCRDNTISAGTVFLTDAGYCLEKIVKKQPIEEYLENVRDYLMVKNCVTGTLEIKAIKP